MSEIELLEDAIFRKRRTISILRQSYMDQLRTTRAIEQELDSIYESLDGMLIGLEELKRKEENK